MARLGLIILSAGLVGWLFFSGSIVTALRGAAEVDEVPILGDLRGK